MDHSDFARRFKKLVSENSNFVVISHQRPDGDAVGSTLAMGLALRDLGKNVIFWNEDPMPKKFDFLPGADLWRTTPTEAPPLDVVVSLDNANKKRLGHAVDVLKDIKCWVNIDHHASNEGYGELSFVDSDSPATGEILYRLMKTCGYNVTREIAMSLFAAISTDTGSFSYPSTSARCLQIAAELVGCGLDVGEISKKIYESYPLSRFLLMQRFLGRTKFLASDRISYSWITPKDYEETKALPEDSEGLIDNIRAIEPVIIAVMFEELSDGKVRLSLRSKDERMDVNKVAQKFGGGGHALAAGARTSGSPQEVEKQVLAELEKYFKK